ncbi:MAG: hypothetical protein ACOCRK_10840 [bacterium]
MKEILFRGKDQFNGEWVYGDLITYKVRKIYRVYMKKILIVLF